MKKMEKERRHQIQKTTTNSSENHNNTMTNSDDNYNITHDRRKRWVDPSDVNRSTDRKIDRQIDR